MKKILIVMVIVFLTGLLIGSIETAKKEINEDQFEYLTENRMFKLKNIGFEGQDKAGTFNNDINHTEPGTVFLTKSGIIHMGKTHFLIPWGEIKSINMDKMAGSSTSILIRTNTTGEKLKLVDPVHAGNPNTLDTSMDTLLRQCKKILKEYRKDPEEFTVEIPKPVVPPVIPAEKAKPEPVTKVKSEPKPETPPQVQTKEIKIGMSCKEVETILGPPLKKVVLADKVIYKYDDMVITFKDGKMADAVVK